MTTRWRLDREAMPARVYQSVGRRYEIIWDPDGWHLWEEGNTPLGIFPTLALAKKGADDR